MDPRALLLRGVSNHEVAIRLARPQPRAQLARALVDFGVQVRVGDRAAGGQGDAATPVVGDIAIGGRPAGLFGAKHRSHTTAWVVFTDVVRSTVLNQPLPVAVQRMSDLIVETRSLPGASVARLKALRNAHQVLPRAGGVLTGRDIYNRGDEAAEAAQDAAEHAEDGTLVAVLQDLVAAYLELRNATPLSVTHDTDTAGGHGEGSARGALLEEDRDEEEADARDAYAEALAGPVPIDPATARLHLWRLLDLSAVKYLVETAVTTTAGYTTVPGSVPGESPARRLADVVAQHLLTVRRAYPRPYEAAQMAGEDSLRGVLGAAADATDASGRSVLAAVQRQLAGAAPVPDVASRMGVQVAPGAPRGTAQLVLDEEDGETYVEQLRLGSRPEGILGAAEGAHLTAFGLVVEGLKTQVEGTPLDEVGQVVWDLVAEARGLATAARIPDLLAHARQRAAAAGRQADAAYARVQNAQPDDPAYVGHLQDLIVAYLWLRNSLPLAAVAEGGMAVGKAEGGMLGVLRAAERAYDDEEMEPDGDAVLDALWGLLDSAALNYVAGTESYVASPGIRDKAGAREVHKRIGDIVATHVRTSERAFPLCVERTRMNTRQVVGAFLRGELPRAAQREAALANQDLALALGGPLAAEIAHYVVHGAFPVRRVAPDAAAGGRPRRNTRPPKRMRDEDFEGEEAFGRQEREMVEEEAEIVRRPHKRQRA